MSLPLPRFVVLAPLAGLLAVCLMATPATASTFTGENPLGVSRVEFRSAQVGMDLVYQGRYPEALEHFELVGVDFPDSALGPVGRQVAYQAMAYEARSDRWDRSYRTEQSEAQERFRRSSRRGGQRSWNRFLEAIHLGLVALTDAREEHYLSALNNAWDAMERIKQVQRDEPEFHDVQLAFGLYNYWRSVYTERLDFLPSFGDRRAEGIAQMQLAKEKGLLAPAPASLALTYTHLDAKDITSARDEAVWAFEHYPTNLINTLLLGSIQKRQRNFSAARMTFSHAVAIAPQNSRAWSLLARELERRRDMRPRARKAYERTIELSRSAKEKDWARGRIASLDRRSERDQDRRARKDRSRKRRSTRLQASPRGL